MKRLRKQNILNLHTDLIEAFGGSHGVRDEGLLDSAVNAPFQSFDGIELYPTILEKAARLGFGLIKNHPFLDGNKRIGVHAMLVFLDINHVSFTYEDAELIELGLSAASGALDYQGVLEWLRDHVN